MAGKQLIDELVAQQAFEQVDRLTKQLGELDAQMLQNLKTAKKYSDSLAGAKSLKDINSNADNANKEIANVQRLTSETDKLTKAQQRALYLAEKRAKIIRESTAADIAAANAQRTETVAVQQNTAALSANEATMRRNNITELQAEQAAARHRAARLGEAVATTEATAATAANTAAQSANSNAFENVGRSLTRGLGYLRTLAYILPGIGIAGIFTLAFGAIEKAANSLGLFNKGINTAQSNLDNFNAVTKDSAKSASESSTNLRILYEAATDVANAERNRLAAAKELQKEFPKTFANIDKETILNGGASASYNQLTKDILANAKAKAIAGKIAEIAAKKAEEEITLLKIQNATTNQIRRAVLKADAEEARRSGPRAGGIGGSGYRVNAAQKAKTAFDEATKAIEKSTKAIKGYDQQIAFLERIGGGVNEIANGLIDPVKEDSAPKQKKDNTYAQYLKQQREVLDGVLDYEKSSYDDRLLAIEAFEGASKILIERGVRAKEFTQLEANTKLLELNNEVNSERLKVEETAQKELLALFKKGLEDQQREYERQKDVIEEFSLANLEAIQQGAEDAQIANEKAYAQGKISKSQYEKAKLDIEYKANRDVIEAQLSLASQLLALQESMGIDVSDQKKKVSELTRKLAKGDAEYEIAQLKSVQDARKRIGEATRELAQEVFDFGVTVVNAGYENEKNRIQEQQDAIDVKKEKEIEAVDRSLASEQEKADKIAVINAKAAAQKEVLDLRARQVAERQAKFQKAVGIAQATVSTYAGAARALADYQAPYSYIIAALTVAAGLAQIGQILATPIPKYAKGTDYHKGGPMIVGDAGTELVIEPSGKQWLTPDTDTLTMAPTGTKVIPNKEVVKMLATPDKINYAGGQAIDIQQLISEQRKTTNAVGKIAVNSTVISKKGWRVHQAKVIEQANYKRNYLT